MQITICPRPHHPLFRARRPRRALTLAELLVASTIMVLIAGAMATLSVAVSTSNTHCRGQLQCAQHARVALMRIEQSMAKAYANEQFPGCLVVTETNGSNQMPQTLVIWSPSSTPTNPTGLPLVSEIVVYAPDPAAPGNLLEIRSSADNSTVPAVTDTSGWTTLTDNLRASTTATKLVLTDRLRKAPLSGAYSDSLAANQLRGVARFRRIVAPSETEWSQYKASTRTWPNITWPLDSYRLTSGTRTVVIHTELQLVPGSMAAADSTTVPFFGSSSISYELQR
jgi:Tfp pilus assembly protein PilW